MSCTLRAGLITVYIEYVCFMYASSCERGITELHLHGLVFDELTNGQAGRAHRWLADAWA